MEWYEDAMEFVKENWHWFAIGGGALAVLYLMNQSSQTPVVQATATLGNANPSTKLSIVNFINQSGVSDTYIYGRQYPATWDRFAAQAGVATPQFPGKEDSPVTFEEWWRQVGKNAQPAVISRAFAPQSLAGGGWIV